MHFERAESKTARLNGQSSSFPEQKLSGTISRRFLLVRNSSDKCDELLMEQKAVPNEFAISIMSTIMLPFTNSPLVLGVKVFPDIFLTFSQTLTNPPTKV